MDDRDPLGVQSATPDHGVAGDDTLEGSRHPLALLCGNHVQVREQHDRIASPAARVARPGRRPLRARAGGWSLDDPRFEALPAKDVDQVLGEGPLVARWVAGIELDGPGEDGAGRPPQVRLRVGIIRPAKPPYRQLAPRGERTRDHRE
jgi:hypothetical protein